MTDYEPDLVAAAKAGDIDAFTALVGPLRAPALRAAYAIAGDDAEDAVQIAMVKSYEHLHRIRPNAPFRPWFFTIVMNEARNRRRSRNRREAVTLRLTYDAHRDIESTHTHGADFDAIRAFERASVLDAFSRLATKDREVLALKYFVDMSESEIASTLGCRPGTVKSRSSRALSRLRVLLETSVAP